MEQDYYSASANDSDEVVFGAFKKGTPRAEVEMAFNHLFIEDGGLYVCNKVELLVFVPTQVTMLIAPEYKPKHNEES